MNNSKFQPKPFEINENSMLTEKIDRKSHALQTAFGMGLACANEINDDYENHQDGAGKMEIHHSIPNADAKSLKKLQIDADSEDIQRAYRQGYNSSLPR